MSVINDRREDQKNKPWGYVVCTDNSTFMSGWGGAKDGRSLYALAVNNHKEAEVVIANARARTDMKRPRLVRSFRANGTPKVRMGANDHMSVVCGVEASRWYEKNGFG